MRIGSFGSACTSFSFSLLLRKCGMSIVEEAPKGLVV